MSLQSQIKSNKEQEDEDLKRAIEASMLMEPTTDTPRNNDPIVIQDDNQLTNPPRHIALPAGLKNVGSSCWYNAVVQEGLTNVSFNIQGRIKGRAKNGATSFGWIFCRFCGK